MCLSFLDHLGYWPVLCVGTVLIIWMLVSFCDLLCPSLWRISSALGQVGHPRISIPGSRGWDLVAWRCVLTGRLRNISVQNFLLPFPRRQWTRADLSNTFNSEYFSFSISRLFPISFLIQGLLLCKPIMDFRLLTCSEYLGHLSKKAKDIILFLT